MYTKHLSKNSSEEVLLYYLKLILSFHRTFCKMMGLKKYTFILIISKPKIYVLSLLLYFKNSMLFNFPEAFVFKYCLLLLFQEQKKILSQILTNSAQSMLQYSQICSFSSFCLRSLSCCNPWLFSKYLLHWHEAGKYFPSFPTNTELKQGQMKQLQ